MEDMKDNRLCEWHLPNVKNVGMIHKILFIPEWPYLRDDELGSWPVQLKIT